MKKPKRNSADTTLRNARASLKRDQELGERLTVLEARVNTYIERLRALEDANDAKPSTARPDTASTTATREV